jgi:hypothetical protein
MVLGFQLTKMPSNSGAVAAAPRKVSGGVGAPAALDDSLVAGFNEGVTGEVLDPELRAASGDVPAGWALAGEVLIAGLVTAKDDLLAGWVLVKDVLEMGPLVLVVVPLAGAAVETLVPP